MKGLERRITEMEQRLEMGTGQQRINVLCVVTGNDQPSKEEQHEAVERYRAEHPDEEYPSGILTLDMRRNTDGQVTAVNWRDRSNTGAPAKNR